MKDMYGKDIKCPKCGSIKIKPIHPFDYLKECEECGEEFSASPHN